MGIGIIALFQLLFLLIVGVCVLAAAISFAVRPSEHKLSILRPLSLGLAFCAAGMICAGAAAALAHAAGTAAFPDAASARLLLGGLAEAFVPGGLGFAILALAWTSAAVGFRRMK